jgi:hypothetical protein
MYIDANLSFRNSYGGQGDQMSLWKFPQNVAQPIFWPKLIHNCYFCNFQSAGQKKQSHNGRKFAQSGHPDGGGVEEAYCSQVEAVF